jgi:tetratricopeptide (TPR) repeat protein/4-amino-4-deoxy-L-arabinose transferase-like glycosyltransferase
VGHGAKARHVVSQSTEPPAAVSFVPLAAAIFVVALLIRLLHLWQMRRSPFFEVLTGDARAYDEWAQRIAAGDWFGSEVFYQAPLYPYFLGVIYAVAGRDLTIVRVCQAVLGSAACVLVGLTAWRLFSKRAAMIAGFGMAIYAVAGRDLTIVRVCQAVLGSAACVLVGLTAWRLFSKRAAMIAGFGMAIYAPAIFFDGLIQKSVLDVFFMSLALWILAGIVDPRRADLRRADLRRADLLGPPRPPSAGPERPGLRTRWFALGLAMGALSLTRENALVLVVVVLGWIIVTNVRLKPGATHAPSIVASGFSRTSTAGAFILGLALVLTPVAARNYAVGGGFYLTTSQFGPNFFIGNNPRSDGTYSSLRPGRGSPEYERQDATDLAERAMGRTLTPGEVSSYWTDRALAFIMNEPVAWMQLVGRKMLLLVNRGEMLDTESQASYAEWSWPLKATGWFAHFGVLVPLAIIGVWVTWADRRRLAIFYALTIAYATSVVMFYVFARYRFPLVPGLLVFAAAGLSALITQLMASGPEETNHGTAAPAAMPSRGQANPRRGISVSSRRGWGPGASGKKLAVAVGVIGVAIVSNWPLLSGRLMKAITETNLATALYENKQFDEAIAHYERAVALRPDYAPAYTNMGAALRSKGRVTEAVAAHEKSLAIQPDNPDTHFNLANALLDLNRPQEAAEHFRLAGRQGPPGANVENNLGIALAAEGKMAEAAAAFRRAVAAEPGSARAHRNLGDALTSLGQFEEGVSHLHRATQLQPENATFHYDLAVALLEGGRAAQAIEEFNAALKIDPAFAPAHNNLGVALGSQGRLDEAVEHFRQALKIQPGYADAQRNLEMALRAPQR